MLGYMIRTQCLRISDTRFNLKRGFLRKKQVYMKKLNKFVQRFLRCILKNYQVNIENKLKLLTRFCASWKANEHLNLTPCLKNLYFLSCVLPVNEPTVNVQGFDPALITLHQSCVKANNVRYDKITII